MAGCRKSPIPDCPASPRARPPSRRPQPYLISHPLRSSQYYAALLGYRNSDPTGWSPAMVSVCLWAVNNLSTGARARWLGACMRGRTCSCRWRARVRRAASLIPGHRHVPLARPACTSPAWCTCLYSARGRLLKGVCLHAGRQKALWDDRALLMARLSARTGGNRYRREGPGLRSVVCGEHPASARGSTASALGR